MGLKSSCRVKSDMVLSFFCALASLIVAFWDQTCNPQMSTWLMVYGLYVPVILAGFIIAVLCLPCMAVLIDVPLCLLIILLSLLIPALFIFPFAWWVYGCVIFWPQVASSPCSLLANCKLPKLVHTKPHLLGSDLLQELRDQAGVGPGGEG